jgi:hypothetical protein
MSRASVEDVRIEEQLINLTGRGGVESPTMTDGCVSRSASSGIASGRAHLGHRQAGHVLHESERRGYVEPDQGRDPVASQRGERESAEDLPPDHAVEATRCRWRITSSLARRAGPKRRQWR